MILQLPHYFNVCSNFSIYGQQIDPFKRQSDLEIFPTKSKMALKKTILIFHEITLILTIELLSKLVSSFLYPVCQVY